jgi:hypothetical protein
MKLKHDQVGTSAKKRKHAITATSWCTLTADETRWAVELKAAVAAAGTAAEVKEFGSTFSDLDFAQYAIVAKGDAEAVSNRHLILAQSSPNPHPILT